MLAAATSSDQVTQIIVIGVRIFVVLVGVVTLLAALRALAAITRYGADPRDAPSMTDSGSGQLHEEGKELDERPMTKTSTRAMTTRRQSHRSPSQPHAPRRFSIAQEMPQPGQPPTWWDPVHLLSTAPEAGLIDTVANPTQPVFGRPPIPPNLSHLVARLRTRSGTRTRMARSRGQMCLMCWRRSGASSSAPQRRVVSEPRSAYRFRGAESGCERRRRQARAGSAAAQAGALEPSGRHQGS